MTEGMPARRSTAVLTMRVTLRVAIWVRYTAQPTARGTPITSAPTVTSAEPARSARIP